MFGRNDIFRESDLDFVSIDLAAASDAVPEADLLEPTGAS